MISRAGKGSDIQKIGQVSALLPVPYRLIFQKSLVRDEK